MATVSPRLESVVPLTKRTAGKVVLVTGGSSGIGLAAAIKFAEAGAITLICARDQVKLDEAVAEIQDKAGKNAQIHAFACDIADEAGCASLIEWCNTNFGGVDFLINNAGRSIRRAIESSYDRFHDFQIGRAHV